MTRETKSYELKIYDQSLMRFEAAYDAFGSLKLEITDIDSANAHLLPLNLIVDQDEKSLASWMEGRTIPKNRAFVEQILSTAGLTRNDILGILDVSKGLSINDSYWLDDAQVLGKEQVEVDNRIPFILGGSVREIAKNHIYGFAGNVLHHLKAIALNNPVAERL